MVFKTIASVVSLAALVSYLGFYMSTEFISSGSGMPVIQNQKASSQLARIAITSTNTTTSLDSWTGKDLYHLPKESLVAFFREREAKYLERRDRIQGVCQMLRQQSLPQAQGNLQRMSEVRPAHMQYLNKYGVAYCHVPKVGGLIPVETLLASPF